MIWVYIIFRNIVRYDAQIDMICHYDVVASFDSMDDAQIDMICHPDEVANFDSTPGNQNDFFFSLFFVLSKVGFFWLFIVK